MYEHDENEDSFEETVRSIARELGRSVERAMERVDLEDMAETIGVDPASAREWADSLGGWLRAQAEHLGDEVAQRGGTRPTPGPAPEDVTPAPPPAGGEDPLSSAAPHPLDLPSDEQGLALTALESGRWSVEAGTSRLISHGEGPGPNDSLGLVRELRVRDWITSEGKLTLAGQHALKRWLDALD
jgi:hypothetical protein